MEKAQQHVVRRPNETIGIVPNGKQRITHLVRRLYSVMLLFSQQQGEREEYSAVLNDMLEAANSSGSNRSQVKAILRDIRAIGVDWNVREGDREVWKNVGLIEEPGLIDGKGMQTVVTWKLPKIIRSRLLDPRGFFTRISLEMMTRLRSGASIALYEICCQYVSNDHGKGEGGLTRRASIAEWMPRLTGSRKADYEYKFLKRDVLLTAIDEINEITDLRVELVEHKVGRRVEELQFRVFRKELGGMGEGVRTLTVVPVSAEGGETHQTAQTNHGQVNVQPPGDFPAAKKPKPGNKQLAEDTGYDQQHYQRIIALGAVAGTAERICRDHADNPRYLVRHLDYVEGRIRNTATAPLVNKIAFLKKALDHGYADDLPPSPLPPTVAPSKQPSPEEILEQQQVLAQRAEVWARFQAMSNLEGKSALVSEFLHQSSHTLKTFYKKNGVNNTFVKAALIEWLLTYKNF